MGLVVLLVYLTFLALSVSSVVIIPPVDGICLIRGLGALELRRSSQQRVPRDLQVLLRR
jgi:hypothetical protein